MTQERHRTTLRLPKELDQKLEEMADEMGVSKNALILMLLAQSIEKVA